jgi:O-antigen ligase
MSSHVMRFADPPLARIERSDWITVLLVLPFAVSGLVDLPRIIQSGTITALGALSIVQLGIAVVGLAAIGAYPRALLARFAPYGLFVTWMVGHSMLMAADQGGIQNGVVYLLFGAQLLLAGTVAARQPGTMIGILRRGFLVLDTVTLGLVLISFLRVGLPGDPEEGNGWLIGERALALMAIVPICWHLAGWCHGRRFASLRALAWILTVLVSLSRTATGVAFVAAAIAFGANAWITPARFVRQLPAVALGTIVLVLVILSNGTTFHARFLEGYNNVEVGGVEISTSGRNQIWPVVIDSGMRHPMVGGGLGSSQVALEQFEASAVGHPHNDYLRVWHDGGFIGLAFLVLAFIPWLVLLGRQWVRSVRASLPDPEIELAALLTLLGIMLAAITDNGFVYAFVMGIGGLLIGAGLGIRLNEDQSLAGTGPLAVAGSS